MEYDQKEQAPYIPHRLFRSMGDFYADRPAGSW